MDINRSAHRQSRLSGRYRLLHLLGRGGMGEVWLAEDSDLKREVALKLLPDVLASDKTYLDAFRYEARAAAALEHPHILTIHDFGEEAQEDGEVTTYLIMPYVAGGTLRDRLQAIDGPLPVNEAMRYLSQAAQAIDYAHSRGVLHRDIKPANMLLHDDSWLLLADFGLAKLLATSAHRSQTHKGAGTPEYMAPEQAQHGAEAASDRYSLGIVAYQLFTAHLPFQGETPYGILIKQIRETPPAPRSFNPALPEAVENVLLQSIAKRPEERPATCAAFVTALEQAWKLSVVEDEDPEATLLAPWSKRHYENVPTQRVTPALSASPYTSEQEGENAAPERLQTISQDSGAALVGAMNSIVSKPPLAENPRVERMFSRRSIIIGGIVASAALAGGVSMATLLHWPTPFWISEKSSLPSLPPGPQKLIPGVPLLSLNGHNDMTNSAEWDPTGRYLATAGIDTRLMLWDIEAALSTGKNSFLSILTPQHTWIMKYLTGDHEICWSADGRNIIVAEGIWMIDPFNNPDHMKEYYDLGAEFNTELGLGSYDSLAWQPGTDSFAASVEVFGSDPGIIAVELWSRSQPQKSLKILRYSHPIPGPISAHTLAWSSDGTLLAAYLASVDSGLTNAYPTDSHQVLIWQVQTGQVQQVISLPPPTHKTVLPWKTPLAWSPVETHLLAFGHWNNAIIWDVQRNAPLLTLSTTDTHDPQVAAVNVLSLAWSPDGRYIAGCYDNSRKIYIWDVHTLRHTAPSPEAVQDQTLFFPQPSGAGHSLSVTSVSWSPDGRYIASTSYDKTVLIWKVDGS